MRDGSDLSVKRCDQIGPLPYNWHVLTEEDKQWISERLEKVETTLLTDLHKCASPVELRQKSHAAALRALDAEVESLSGRLKKSRRPLIDPSPQSPFAEVAKGRATAESGGGEATLFR